MDTKGLLEQMLETAKELTAEGRILAEKKLGLPDPGETREAMVSGMGKGALAAGVLALLLGTHAGRRLGGTALKLGGLAAVGTLAYQALKNWQAEQGKKDASPGRPIHELDGPRAKSRSEVLLKAMIAAANADGHIDERERATIKSRVAELGLTADAARLIREQISTPVDVAALAARADSPETAAEIYLVSRLMIDIDNESEKAYLDRLAAALKLAPDLVAQLEAQVAG